MRRAKTSRLRESRLIGIEIFPAILCTYGNLRRELPLNPLFSAQILRDVAP